MLPAPFQGNGRQGGQQHGYNPSNLGGGLGAIFSSIFSQDPYKAAQQAGNPYYQQAVGAQNPFYQAGTGALQNYQGMLAGMSDPSGFINHLTSQYQESPFAKYQQEQSLRSAKNFGSANGLGGSTPLTQQIQQNAQNISGKDMDSWLQNVLGVNRDTMNGYQNLITGGQNAANNLSTIYGNQGSNAAEGAYGSTDYNNQNMNNLFGGIGSLISGFF